MRLALLAASLLFTAATAIAQNLPADRWDTKAREIYARAITFQTVQGRNHSPQLAEYLAGEYRAAGFTDVQVRPHDETAALVVRWPAARPSGRKAILLMAHMDVVEAR
ncbi:MAG: M20/M25/M40 family metallo-hydrolase, partial [Allosphingosinicella sp.]